MQTFALVFACVALLAGAHACSDDTSGLQVCQAQFESQVNALIPELIAGRASQMAICPLGSQATECMLRVVGNFCNSSMRSMLRTMVTQIMQDAMMETGCHFSARRDTEKLMARSAELVQKAALLKTIA